MSQYGGVVARKKDLAVPDPHSRLSSLRGWWQVEQGLIKSGGAFASLTDLTGLGHSGVPVAGKNLPAINAASANMGNKPTIGFSKDGVGQPVLFSGVNLAPPFTIYLAAYMGADVGVVQIMFDGATAVTGNYPRIYTYAGGPPDKLAATGAPVGIDMTSSKFVLTAAFPTSGNLAGFAKNSETFDTSLSLGNLGCTGFVLGIDRTYTPSNAWDGEFAELIIVSGIDSRDDQRDMLAYFQARYAMSIDYDPPGKVYREKFIIDVGSNPSQYPTRALSALLSPNGALRIQTRYTPVTVANGHSNEFEWAQYNAGAGPFLKMDGSGVLAITVGSVTYTAELDVSWDTLHDVEFFCILGGGTVPELAYRVDGTGGKWLQIPLPTASATIAAITASGNINLGGDSNGSSVLGTFKEVVTFTDGAQPAGYKKPTYAAGVMAIVGDSAGRVTRDGSWPQLALANVTKSYPMPRLLGLFTDNYEAIHARRATDLDPLLVSGGKNVLVIASGGRYSITGNGDTAAAAFSALQTLVTAARTAGWNYILVGTILPSSGLTDATRVSLNSLITGGTLTGVDGIIDFASNATIGAAGAYTNTTYYKGDQIGLTLAGGRLAAPYATTTLNAVLP